MFFDVFFLCLTVYRYLEFVRTNKLLLLIPLYNCTSNQPKLVPYSLSAGKKNLYTDSAKKFLHEKSEHEGLYAGLPFRAYF